MAIALLGLSGGLAARLGGADRLADLAWTIGVAPVLAALLWQIGRSLRQGDVGLDLVAALSMAGALAVGEALAAAVVALMYAGGQTLESYASGRADRELRALLARVPHIVLRYTSGRLAAVPIEQVAVNDRLLIRLGDVLPVDGWVSGRALLDEAAVTGESLPVLHRDGESVMSGTTNAGAPFDLVASEPAARSTYAGIVRLVSEALERRAPSTRLADRYALGFMAATLVLSAIAWAASQDPIRAVAVLVVATPCPLILAVPIAIVAGISRAAGAGVMVKGGGALEACGRMRTLVVDKTGTLTQGSVSVTHIDAAEGWTEDEVLRLGASLDQASQHPVAQAIVRAANRRALPLALPSEAKEVGGEGIEGTVCGRRLRIGQPRFALPDAGEVVHAASGTSPGTLTVALSQDGRGVGTILLRDTLRAGLDTVLARLRASGIRRIVLATGDHRDVAEAMAARLGLDRLAADLPPEGKVALVEEEKAHGPVMMVGDGVNDAPALAAADLGVALGAKGAAASAEAADVILLRDSLDGLADLIEIGTRTRRIALQSVVIGIVLSTAGMVAAALGWLGPVEGALLQEAIDVAAIANALRALKV
ncbi:heavy metal translocating P-type ATPase [Aureimonas sp. AU4]|uniref:heavy metal translocating P-type ATPase n=1 Tax=Aureimonas sp. AU4 TaxID=1638163 RepID=UPI000780BCFC|nr:heavy metal translocating P-type ATPase [Aureimonas sp. AU4]